MAFVTGAWAVDALLMRAPLQVIMVARGVKDIEAPSGDFR